MRAELLRELGDMDGAKQVLSHVDSEEMAAVVSQIRSLFYAGDTHVRELTFGT